MTRTILAFVVFCLWWMALALLLKAITVDVGELPVDYRTYAIAAERIELTGSPYVGAPEVQAIWNNMHESAEVIFRPEAVPDGEVSVISGPYLYPPSLALIIAQSGMDAIGFIVMLTVATVGLCIGWFRTSRDASLLWLLPMAGSIDLIAIFLGGNVEIILITLSLTGCRLMWSGQAIWAIPVVAPVLLVKPHFALLFLAFGVMWSLHERNVATRLMTGGVAVLGVLLIFYLEFQRWPADAQVDFLAYVSDPASRQYFSLPTDQQWPMRVWNRAPLQLLMNAGLGYQVSQTLVLGIYIILLVVSVNVLRGRQISFAIMFSIAYVLFMIGRPITWSMPFLAVFVLMAVWPQLSSAEKRILAISAFLVGISHWLAFSLFVSGVWPGLLTLQAPDLPWETILVMFGSWLVAIGSARRCGRDE